MPDWSVEVELPEDLMLADSIAASIRDFERSVGGKFLAEAMLAAYMQELGTVRNDRGGDTDRFLTLQANARMDVLEFFRKPMFGLERPLLERLESLRAGDTKTP